MFLVKLHDMIKQNYEQGLYSQNYTYKGYTNKSNLTSDFIMEKIKLVLTINTKKGSNIIPSYYLN